MFVLECFFACPIELQLETLCFHEGATCYVFSICHVVKAPVLNVSYKPQKISPKSQGTVRQLLHDRIRDSYIHPQFVTDVIKPLHIEQLFDQQVKQEYVLCV